MQIKFSSYNNLLFTKDFPIHMSLISQTTPSVRDLVSKYLLNIPQLYISHCGKERGQCVSKYSSYSHEVWPLVGKPKDKLLQLIINGWIIIRVKCCEGEVMTAFIWWRKWKGLSPSFERNISVFPGMPFNDYMIMSFCFYWHWGHHCYSCCLTSPLPISTGMLD